MSIDAWREAFERVGGRFDARVLEPSPPAVDEPPWFADDPVAAEPRQAASRCSARSSNGDLTWDDVGRRAGARPRGLVRGALARRVPAASPAHRTATSSRRRGRAARGRGAGRWHPARRRANGKIGLRYTAGGFGTPVLRSEDEQVAR